MNPAPSLLLGLLWACSPSPAPETGPAGTGEPTTEDTATPVVAPPAFTALDDARLLRRLSLDLRGVLPSPEELAQVQADPAALDSLRDAFLLDPRFETQLVGFFAEEFKTRVDTFQVPHEDYGLDAEQECAYERAVGEEPLRLMAWVGVRDQPWQDTVTVPYTIAPPLLREIWGLSGEGEDWAPSTYNDGRPAAGVLGTNGLWWRYVTSASNGNRSRAAALSQLLLCEDLLGRPVSFGASDSAAEATDPVEMIQSNDACIACHSSVDPLAGALFGFYPSIDYNTDELGEYHGEREGMAEEILGTPPAYFGTPMGGLADLGWAVAEDPRFYSCTVQTAARMLWRRPTISADLPTLHGLKDQFVAADLRYQPLIAAVTDTPEYRAGGLTAEGELGPWKGSRTTRLLSPPQLATAVEDLTGFVWEQGGCSQLENDDVGFRVLAGGVDGDKVVRPQDAPGLTWALVVQRLAQGAATTVVAHDLRGAETPRLLALVDPDTRAEDPAFEAQLDALGWRLFARPLTQDEHVGLAALWSGTHAAEGVEAAWVAVVSVLLRDPDFVTR